MAGCSGDEQREGMSASEFLDFVLVCACAVIPSRSPSPSPSSPISYQREKKIISNSKALYEQPDLMFVLSQDN